MSLSLRALADRTGFSASFLSQVELGQSSPSLASLQKICAALDIELVDLLRDAQPPSNAPVMRREQREPVFSQWSRATAASVLPTRHDDRLRAMALTLEAGGRTGAIARERGNREFAYCTRGRVVLVTQDARHELAEGDAVVLDDLPQTSWENAADEPAELLLVSARVAP